MRDSIEEKIREVVSSCTFDEKQNLVITKDFASFINKLVNVLRKKGSSTYFLSSNDIVSIVFDPLYKKSLEIKANESNLITFAKEDVDLLTEEIIARIAGLPEPYKIVIDIPLFSGQSYIEHHGISIGCLPKAIPDMGLLSNLLRKDVVPPKVKNTLAFEIEGFLAPYNDTYKKILSYIKVIVQRGIARNIYVKNKSGSLPLLSGYLSAAFGQEKNQKTIPYYTIAYKSENSFRKDAKLDLPDEVNSFLHMLEINEEIPISSAIEKNILGTLQESCAIIFNTDEQTKYLYSAIEWCFDAYTLESRNLAMAFLNVCFGLEALFTEKANTNELSITRTLAIKCSYLIAGSVSARKMIEDQILDIYKVRSKLVHGIQSSLTAAEEELFPLAKKLLEASINKELQLLMPSIVLDG